jgi:hypothetical protein
LISDCRHKTVFYISVKKKKVLVMMMMLLLLERAITPGVISRFNSMGLCSGVASRFVVSRQGQVVNLVQVSPKKSKLPF